jgi:hypothetical protein
MTTPGRPTGYRPEYAQSARNYCELGATNDQLARFFGVSARTIDNWIVNFRDFGQAVREARVQGDEALWRSCYQRAKGYYYTEKRVVRDADKERVEISTRHCKADLRAFMIWHRNRTQWLARTGAIANDGPMPPPSFDVVELDEQAPDVSGLPDGPSPDPAFYGLAADAVEGAFAAPDTAPPQEDACPEVQSDKEPTPEGEAMRSRIDGGLPTLEVAASSPVRAPAEPPRSQAARPP